MLNGSLHPGMCAEEMLKKPNISYSMPAAFSQHVSLSILQTVLAVKISIILLYFTFYNNQDFIDLSEMVNFMKALILPT